MMIDRHIHDDDSFGGFPSTQPTQLQHVSSSTSSMNNCMNELNLSVVNEAYGNNADLYLHVLRVKPNAGSAQIQEAYFDRRNELFYILSKMNRPEPEDNDDDDQPQQKQYIMERKMDAVVCAVRILGDPDLRLQYDDVRTERIRLYNNHHRTAAGHHHGTISPNTTTTASINTITHKNRNHNNNNNNSSMINPTSSTIISPPSPSAKQLSHKNIQIINTEGSFSLFPTEAIPDVMSSTGTVSTADHIQNDNANTSTTFLNYFSIHESMNVTNYFESTVNSFYSTRSTSPTAAAAAATTSTFVTVDSEGVDTMNRVPPLNSPKIQDYANSHSTKSNPIPLTSSKRQVADLPRMMTSSSVVPTSPPIQKRLPLMSSSTPLQTPQTFQRRITSNGTTTTDGDGSTAQYSKESTLYYDDDEEEEDTYYTMDEEEDDDDDEIGRAHV